MNFRFPALVITLLLGISARGQMIRGLVKAEGEPLPYATLQWSGSKGLAADSVGRFVLDATELKDLTITVSALGYKSQQVRIPATNKLSKLWVISLSPTSEQLNEVVVSGTLSPRSKSESAVAVERYEASFFKSNPTNNLLEAMGQINGLRPQINCGVCYTGDLRINGLDGPYTMVLIDGTPIVSGLGTVYGFSGIPTGLIERVEVIKGPASTLYGSEAVAGMINIITQSPTKKPAFTADVWGSTWLEKNVDLGMGYRLSTRIKALSGINLYHYGSPKDQNGDGFMDVPLQSRFSAFQKFDWERNRGRSASIAGRWVMEDRSGGQMNYRREFRGGDSVYGEQISTRRWELLGHYDLPVNQKMRLTYSLNSHEQNSMYGTSPYVASQYIGFIQATWDKSLGSKSKWLNGLAYRFTWYDDNTPATQTADGSRRNLPASTPLPGFFSQYEWRPGSQNTLLAGIRWDQHPVHGQIFSPRLNYKLSSKDQRSSLRIALGNGFRVANVFTEDHAALSGARRVVFTENLRPEQSYNLTLNASHGIFHFSDFNLLIDASAFITHFSNRILPDYDTDPNLIIYGNLNGFARSQGVSANIDADFVNGLDINLGATLMDVSVFEEGIRSRQPFTEQFSAVWTIGYRPPTTKLRIDYTGTLYSPMRLPLLGELDPRSDHSPWWSIQNLQINYLHSEAIEFYVSIKNLLNWTPVQRTPFLIARANDPFDRQVETDARGRILATSANPYALSFDPTNVYAPNQGIRALIGIRLKLSKGK
jgi:outer membrane receptor for ferrienterochelin and colicins